MAASRPSDPKYISLEEAKSFLHLYLVQVLAYLNDLRDIEQQLRGGGGRRRRHRHHQVKEAEKEANRLFEKLRAKLCSFMAQGNGLKL